MTFLDLLLVTGCFAGALLLLRDTRMARRRGLAERLVPYAPPTTTGRGGATRRPGLGSVLAPFAESFGQRLGTVTGVRTDLPTRLARAGRDESPAAFRMTQFLRTVATFIAVGTVLALWRPGPLVSLLALAGLPLLVALGHEQALEADARRRREDIELQLPVIAEQLGVLLGAGLSLTAAMDRLARRGSGVVARDLATVVRATRQGRSEVEALREWAAGTEAGGVATLVGVLSLHRDTSELGDLISTEARAIRAATHRELLELIERRAQLVWVPVTVATLVPGLILIGVPFVSAMSQVTG